MESMECGHLYPYENGTQNSVCDDILNMKSDSFRVDMEPFSHLTNYSPRFNLQRSLSRKGSQIAESVDNERDTISSPKVDTVSEKSTPVIVVATEQQLHHQISITTGGTTAITAGTPTKSRLIGKRSSSFKQTSIISPRRILFFFATMSSMGTVLLIYFTLAMAKYNVDDNLLN
ncbi:hypothetical protein L2E82_31322 [Cichorium intybus]|uniref:Uncharacterized protein n=1 Tax=Cichorium intybus TaxID=13427 RepID=A0ACB9D304_CICIN|nr:hypothetical protein L2E82_31322 [Cichorium intybus]